MRYWSKILLAWVVAGGSLTASPLIKVMLLTGVSDERYHSWEMTSAVVKRHLDDAGIFQTELVICPADVEGKRAFSPDWLAYDVIVMVYNDGNWAKDPTEQSEWSYATKQGFKSYVREGGGLVIQHSTNNGFPDWLPFLEMSGVGGWGGRSSDEGRMVVWRDGAPVHLDHESRPRHPPRGDFWVTVRDRRHPITRGLPETWLQPNDEIYTSMRGPAKNLQILATAYSDPSQPRGSAEHEPMLMVIRYGKGRVFHTTLGHCSPGDEEPVASLETAGFKAMMQYGTEWAATGDVTLPPIARR